MRGPFLVFVSALLACGGAQRVEPASPDLAASEPVTAPSAPVLTRTGATPPERSTAESAPPLIPFPDELPDQGIPDPAADGPGPTREDMAPSRPSLPAQVAGIPLGARFDPAHHCSEYAVDPNGSGFVGCVSPPVILTDMNPTIAVSVLGGVIVGVMLFFDRSPLSMLSAKYGKPEYWRTDGKARPVAALIPKVGLAVWRLADGQVSLRQGAKRFDVMYDASDVRKAIESANY